MESGHRSGGGSAPGGGAGAEGVLCHACGYQYPNGHPSAKQRRAHRKHCGKPTSAAAAAEEEEHDGSELLLDEATGGAGAGGGGVGASAAECGGGSPGSAPEAGSAVEGGGDSAEHSSSNDTGHQGTGDKSAEECLISSSNIPSETIPEASRTDDYTLTTVATQYSEKGFPIEDGDSSDLVVGPEHLQGVPTSIISQEPEDGAKFSPEISEHETHNSISEYDTQNSTVVVPESNATGGGSSEQTNDVVRQVDGIVVTDEDDMMNTICKNKSSEDKSVEGDEFGLSYQENLQSEIDEGHSITMVEEDSADKNLNVIHNEEIPRDDTESNQLSKDVLTGSFEKIPSIEKPMESSTEKSIGIDDGLITLGVGGSHTETSEAYDVKPQQLPVSTSETADHLAVSKGADYADEQYHPISDGSIQTISSALEPVVGGAANFIDNVCSSGVTIDDTLQKNVTNGTIATSQVDLRELSTSAAASEINMVGSTNDVDEKRHNEKVGMDLTSFEVGDMNVEDVEEKQQSKEVIVDPFLHEVDAVSSTDNHGENKQSEEITADTSYCISAVQSMSITEEKEQIEEFIANLASEEINVTSSRDMVEEKKQDEMTKTDHEINGAHSIEATEENNATSETNEEPVTDDVEDKMPNEEITTCSISHNVVGSSIEEKMHNKEVTDGLSSYENIVLAEEKMHEETMSGPTLDKFTLGTSTDSVEERKDEKTSAGPTSHEANVVCTTDNADEENYVEPTVVPTSSINTVGSIGDVENKKQSEDTTADPRSIENTTITQSTDDAENSTLNENTAATGPSDEAQVPQKTDVAEETEKVEDTASKEITTIESTDDLKGATDQNEEIADKEMVMDLDKNHVSLKALLADKNVETKEKEKKASTKDRVLSFRRLVSKDTASPVKPGSPKAGSGQQDWNSPARLPVEKKPKGRKQQWVPFICCSSVQ